MTLNTFQHSSFCTLTVRITSLKVHFLEQQKHKTCGILDVCCHGNYMSLKTQLLETTPKVEIFKNVYASTFKKLLSTLS